MENRIVLCESLVILPQKCHEYRIHSIPSCNQREREFSSLSPSTLLFQTSIPRESFLWCYLFIAFMSLSPRHYDPGRKEFQPVNLCIFNIYHRLKTLQVLKIFQGKKKLKSMKKRMIKPCVDKEKS